MSKVKVAVVQAGSIVFDTGRTLDKAATFAKRAATAGATLAVFPEAFVGGYPKGLDFGARVGSRTPEGREDFRRYWEGAVQVPGPETAVLGELAAAHRLHLVIGVIERDGGTLYCTSLCFGPDGALLGRHRKLMPTAAERLIWGFGDGSTLPVIPFPAGTIGMAICWENYMPLFRTAMYAKGVGLWCAPTVDDRETWLPTMRHIAMEGRCFVLSACQYLRRADCPEEYHAVQGDDPETVLIKGGSVIVSPLGHVLAGPLRDGEGVLIADVDSDDLARAKYDFDVVGHYARPDVFALSVDERPKPAVRFHGVQEPLDRPGD
jgi:nitrilase